MNDIEILKLKSKGYCCSQIMVQRILDLGERGNRELVHFARGLCMGSGLGSGTCGILTAGICILAMYAPDDPDLRASMQAVYMDSFTGAAPGGSQCRQIAGTHYPDMNPDTCPALLTRALTTLMAILTEYGIDPADLDDE
ncbi:MAG: C-GCAxxG-C-C family protein [Desulfobacter sp.]|nr:MAG: C-GCAxxG-C-C family protein [Desulfobacter sp.]